MNPNLAIFLKRSVYGVITTGILFGVYYGISKFTTFSFEKAGAYLMYGFFGIMMVGMLALIIGVTFREVWTNILRRSETITLCCPDKSDEGIHIVAKHYFSGGETSNGYDAWQHYYIRISDGKIFMSKKVKEERSLVESIKELSEKVNVRLEPDKHREVKVGYYEENDKPIERSLHMPGVTLVIRSFNRWLDYGFRITCFAGERKMWQRTL